MANAYEIPFAVPDISRAAAMLIGVNQSNRANELAARNADTQAAYAKNAEKRASAQAIREKHQFDQGEKDRRVKAVQSANELRRQGRHSEADMLLKLNGVQATPTIGPAKTTAPEIVTPMSAAASLGAPEPGQSGSPYEGPAAPHFSQSVPTPMAAAANTMPRPGTGVSVPEEPPAMPMVAPPEEDAMAMGPPSAERDLMPITLPGKTTPGQPTGAFTYKGPDGQDIGTFDPSEEERFRADRAGRVSTALGPLGAQYQQIAKLIASGDIDQKEGAALMMALRAEAGEKAKVSAREDQQTFQAAENDKYRNEGVTISDRNRWEEGRNRARMAAAPSFTGPPAAMSDLSAYAIANPGDQPGLYRKAADLDLPGKAVASVIGQTKATESQSKDAKQAAIGLRAVSDIEKSGYAPSRDEIQKWLNNQREVYLAQKAGESGFLPGLAAGKAQKYNILAQSEVEGLPPPAQQYFANVRRFMETIGRAQSGAAISATEWQNFFNQYGPTSPGGLGAARQYLEEQLRASGVAGKSIAPAAGAVRSVRMPDGSVQKFDASGKRVQ